MKNFKVNNPLPKIYFLSGFMGCGKTTAGKLAAEKADAGFIDLDEEIVKTAKMPIPEIFAKHGEQHFRSLETSTVALVIAASSMTDLDKPVIVALGGGTIIDPQNASMLIKNGVTVFIDTEFETCYNRIKNDKNRPLVNSKPDLENLYRVRQTAYEKFCVEKIDGNCNTDELAERIAKLVTDDADS
jgi:shikimate kinase